jgi:hypothetical protein
LVKFSDDDGAQLLLFEVPLPAPADMSGRQIWNKSEHCQELVEAMLDFGGVLTADRRGCGRLGSHPSS